MRISTLISMCLAILLAGIAAFLVKVWLENQVAEPRVVQSSNTQKVVVSSATLRFGTELTPAVLKEVDWPANATPPGSFGSIKELLNGQKRSVLATIEKNEPVLKRKVTGPGQRASLSALISGGDMKAITIRVNDVKGVAGFILPGDRVDIFLTRREGGGGTSRRQFTDILLQNVKVLAVDQIADDRSDKPAVAKAVTVEVDTIGAQKLVLASSAGTLSLALRRAGETQAASGRRVTLGDLGIQHIGSAPSEAKEKIAEIKKSDIYSLIGVVRGIKRDEVSVPKE